MPKSKRQKSEDNPRSALWLHRADSAWGAYVHARYNRCAVNNGHCAGRLEAHHLSPHGAPLQFAEWLRVNMPEKHEWVIAHAQDWKTVKADYKAAYEALKNSC